MEWDDIHEKTHKGGGQEVGMTQSGGQDGGIKNI